MIQCVRCGGAVNLILHSKNSKAFPEGNINRSVIFKILGADI